jgi:4-hydroxy-3-methylbut-2-enyl diphosphate reductase IspH
MVEEAVAEGDTVRTLGPLIHNEQEMQRLGKYGVTTISEPVQIQRGETRRDPRARRNAGSAARA